MESGVGNLSDAASKLSFYHGISPDVIDTWFFMESPLMAILIIVIYIVYVLYLGPRMMANRKPFELKGVMILYNLSQVLCCFYLMWLAKNVEPVWYMLIGLGCELSWAKLDHRKWIIKMFEIHYAAIFVKYWDLMDTVFFVLRKKQSHVTFLHVYHHASMALSSHLLLKYMPCEEASIVGLINNLVHLFMYTYYLIAALGPRFKKYLWWKKYLTVMQLVQFVIFIIYFTAMHLFGCPKKYFTLSVFNYYFIGNVLIFLILFLDFYRKKYQKNKKEKSLKKLN